MGAGHHVTALYEIVGPGKDGDNPNIDPLKYTRRPPRAPTATILHGQAAVQTA